MTHALPVFFFRSLSVLVAALCFVIPASAFAAFGQDDLPQAARESMGFSSQRLERLHTLIQDEVNRKQLAGAITLLASVGRR
jgi:hypothetical protein